MKYLPLSLIFILQLSVNHAFTKEDTTIVHCNGLWKKQKENVAGYFIKSYENADELFQVEKYKKPHRIKESITYQTKKQKVKQGLYQRFGRNGKLDLKGLYEKDERVGEWIYFHENGQISSKGYYLAGERDSLWQNWDEDGNLTIEKRYVNGVMVGEFKKWENNKLIEQGEYSEGKQHGEWITWYENGELDETGVYETGEKNGEWNYYYESGKKAAQEIYKDGKFEKALWWNEDGSTKAFDGNVLVDPEFPGGQDEMINFIIQELVYPPVSVESGESGVVYVQFTVQVNGKITDVNIIRGVTEDIDDETIRLVKAMPKWTPGSEHNRVKPIKFVLPINFRLG